MYMDMNKIFQAVKVKHPEAVLKDCREVIANGESASQTEVHGYLVDNLYFVNSRTLEVCDASSFFMIEEIEEALLD